jgi:RimJ/RimL family protein N-acetyltransferase
VRPNTDSAKEAVESSALEIMTQRLIMTALTGDDAVDLFSYRSDPEVCRYQTWAPSSLGEAQRFIDSFRSIAFDTPGTWFQLGIRLRDYRVLIGDLGVHFLPDEPEQVEIGVTVAPGHQGLGFGTEAVEGLLGHLFGPLRKHRALASVDPRNLPSVRLMQRVGMRQEAHFRESLHVRGEWVDDLVFALLQSEWSGR